MSMKPPSIYTASAALFSLVTVGLHATPALAGDDKGNFPVSIEVSTGIEYDSNVSVDEIDQSTNKGDFAAVLDAGIGFDVDLGENTDFNLGYDFSQNWQFDFSQFDIQTHRGTVGVDHDFGPATAGLTYIIARSSLDGDGFMTLQRYTPSLSGFVGKKIYLRGSYDYTDKDFDNRVDRDAESHAGGMTAFLFINGTKTFVSGGYKYKTEDAVDPIFDYDSHTFRARFSHDVDVGDRELEFSLGWKYEDRNYDNVNPVIGDARSDNRHKFTASLEIPLSDHFFTQLEYEYDDYSSNLDNADFSQNIGGIRLGARF